MVKTIRFSMFLLSLAAALAVEGTMTPALAARLTHTVSLSESSVRLLPGAEGASVSVTDREFVPLAEPGRPALPFRVVGVLLPQGHAVSSFHAEPSGRVVIAENATLAAAPAQATEDGHIGAGVAMVTSTPSQFPAERVRLLGVGTLHGYTIASFAVFPLRLESGAVVLHERVVLEIETVPAAHRGARLLERRRDNVRARARAELARIAVNAGDADLYHFTTAAVPKRPGGFSPTPLPSLEGSPVDYVIVCPDSLAPSFQALADFKTLKGVPTVIRTVEWILANYRNGADTPETIRNFVIDAYQKWGITYLLIGGDTGEVPARFAFSGFYDGGRDLPVDMYFGCLDGDWNADHDAIFGEANPTDDLDLYAEVYVGRMPASSQAEVAMQIGKIVAYETPANLTFAQKVLLLGEVLFPMGWQPPAIITLNGGDLTEAIYNSQLLPTPGLTVTRMYETEQYFPGAVDENRTAVLAQLNTGYNHVVHVGHGFRFNMSVGDASIVSADADALTNGNKLFCLYFLNCTGAAFTYYCLAEHYLRNPNGGAVTVIGSNESAFPNAAVYYMNEYYDLLFNQGVTHTGEAFARSRLTRTSFAVLGENIDLWTHYIYTLLGDPELPMWTGPVTTLAVAHPSSVSKGVNAITVTVTDGGSPVDSATVCLAKGEDDYAVGTTDGAGQVTLEFRAESAGAISVVATGRNHARYSGSITVGGSGAYVKIASINVDDDGLLGTTGNGNGVIEGGETIDFAVTLTNTGNATTGNVSYVLRTSDPGASIIDSTAAVAAPIPPSGSGVATGGVRVAFDETLADEHAVPFNLVIRENGFDTWEEDFKALVHQPGLGRMKLRIDDTGTGNGNGVVEAGEQFKLHYVVKNYGTGAFPGGSATVYDLDDGFTSLDSTDTYAALAPVASGETPGGFELVEPSVAIAHRLRVSIIDLYGRAYEDTVELRPPTAPTALVIDPSMGSDRLKVTWSASASPDVTHYNVYRSLSAGGPFAIASADPIAHTLFVNEGLSANTIYHYRVAAVDVSGNESVVSPTGSGSTNPQQVNGWPIAVKVELNSSPAVGDIDGDGDNEIVVCGDKVYAWHDDGVELVDGDNDAQTWGVLSSEGNSFVSHPALARIDAVPGLDIVAASRVTKQVFIFHHDGTVLPGWPRPVENELRSGMVVGDLDADNTFEVIAVDHLGVIYVWNHDGTELIDGDANPVTQGVFYRMTGCSFNYSTPAVADVDADGKEELIVGSQGDRVYVFNENGSISPGWPYVLTSDISGSPVIGDVDANGDLEIVVAEYSGSFRVLNHDGTQQLFQFFQNGAGFFNPTPAIGNVTGDAKLEMFMPSKNGKMYGISSNGNYLPGWPVTYATSSYTESSPIIADIDGNGAPDILIGDETLLIDAFNVAGQSIQGFPLGTGDAMRGVPTAADVDDDGDIDLIATGWDKSVYVWDFAVPWNPAVAMWPRFHGNLHNNGRLGFTVPTPVLGATFSFNVLRDGLELVWGPPAGAGTAYAVARAEVVNGSAGVYHALARDLGIGVDGNVRFVDRGVSEGSRYSYRLSNEQGIVDETVALAIPVTRAALGQNHPNPFNPATTIEYWVPGLAGGGRTPVSLVIYDVRGARVKTLVSTPQAAGRYAVPWDGRDERGSPASSGVYFYRMTTPTFSDVRKMVLLK